VDGLVDIDDSQAGLDGNLRGIIPVAAPGPPRADGHVMLPAIGQRLTALFDCRWAGDKGAGSDGANQ